VAIGRLRRQEIRWPADRPDQPQGADGKQRKNTQKHWTSDDAQISAAAEKRILPMPRAG